MKLSQTFSPHRWLARVPILAAALFLPLSLVHAQTVLLSDNFDSYTSGSSLAGQGGWVQSPVFTAPIILSAGTPLGPSIAVNGLIRTGSGIYDNRSIAAVGHSLNSPLNVTGQSIVSIDAYAFSSTKSHATAVYLSSADLSSTIGWTAEWYADPRETPKWTFQYIGGQVSYPGGFDQRVHLETIIDGATGEVYGRLTDSNGVFETPHIAISSSEIASLTDVFVTEDYRDPSYLGADYDNLVVTTTPVSFGYTLTGTFVFSSGPPLSGYDGASFTLHLDFSNVPLQGTTDWANGTRTDWGGNPLGNSWLKLGETTTVFDNIALILARDTRPPEPGVEDILGLVGRLGRENWIFSVNWPQGTNTLDAPSYAGVTPIGANFHFYNADNPPELNSYYTVEDVGVVKFPNTPVGDNISVQPIDATTGLSPVILNFADVTESGATSLTTTATGQPTPSGFQAGNPRTYFDLTTTAEFSGQVRVCISYIGSAFGDPSKIRLFHFENDAWADVTASNDTTNGVICGDVTSFSAFAIFESIYEASIQQPINIDGSSVFQANRATIPVKFALASNGLPTCELPSATIDVTRVSATTSTLINENSLFSPSDSGSNFRTGSCQYIYNLDTRLLGPGKYSVKIIIKNVLVGNGSFGLR